MVLPASMPTKRTTGKRSAALRKINKYIYMGEGRERFATLPKKQLKSWGEICYLETAIFWGHVYCSVGLKIGFRIFGWAIGG